MKHLIILSILVCFFSCQKEEVVEPKPSVEYGLCLYKINVCTNANPIYCPPYKEYVKCIPEWEAYKYSVAIYKIEDCDCGL